MNEQFLEALGGQIMVLMGCAEYYSMFNNDTSCQLLNFAMYIIIFNK